MAGSEATSPTRIGRWNPVAGARRPARMYPRSSVGPATLITVWGEITNVPSCLSIVVGRGMIDKVEAAGTDCPATVAASRSGAREIMIRVIHLPGASQIVRRRNVERRRRSPPAAGEIGEVDRPAPLGNRSLRERADDA